MSLHPSLAKEGVARMRKESLNVTVAEENPMTAAVEILCSI
jgi:hypothetical protein